MNQILLSGVPPSIQRDAWWLCEQTASEAAPPAAMPGESRTGERRFSPAFWLLLMLILLGDLMFWQLEVRLGFGVMVIGIFVAVCVLLRPGSAVWKPVLLLAVSLLPLIEYLQALSVGFALLGLAVSVAWLRAWPGVRLPELLARAAGLLRALPLSGIRAGFRAFGGWLRPSPAASRGSRKPAFSALCRNWALPVGGAMVLAVLLLEANPVLENALRALLDTPVNGPDPLTLFLRLMLWCGLAMLAWPFLTFESEATGFKPRAGIAPARLGVNAGSVLRALVVFNLMLGVQSLMDLSILYGGAELPNGMSLARYAHRGAYPLLATAMLAGGFALLARPFVDENRWLKALLLLWLGQNAMLGLTSLLRLELYVEAYGLTYMRIHAAIWMCLVAAGLLLTAWQVLRKRSNGWLLVRGLGLGLGTLYVCSFVNFAGLIAATSLARPEVRDWHYLCSLGPMAAAEVSEALRRRPELQVPRYLSHCWPLATDPSWRELDYRTWRVSHYTDAQIRANQLSERRHAEDPSGR